MNRRASSLVPALVFAVLLITAAAGLAQTRVARLRALQARQARIAARELALGAAALADGATVEIGAWSVRRDGVHLQASGPDGTYAIAADGERWIPARVPR
jgi:hypothetical protein